MKRESFVFYRSFANALLKQNDKQLALCVRALCSYALDGLEDEYVSSNVAMFMELVKPQIDANNRKYENGKKGGRKNQTETKIKPNDNQSETIIEPNVNDNVNVNVNANVNDNVNENVYVNEDEKENVLGKILGVA